MIMETHGYDFKLEDFDDLRINTIFIIYMLNSVGILAKKKIPYRLRSKGGAFGRLYKDFKCMFGTRN